MSKNTLGGALLMEMGTGKTLCAVSIANILQRNLWKDDPSCNAKILVLCPKAVVSVWPAEFEKMSAIKFKTTVLRKRNKNGTLSTSLPTPKQKLEIFKAGYSANEPTVIVINYEAAKRDPLKKAILSKHWDIVFADEMHKFKGEETVVGKFMNSLGNKAEHRLGLTGTEMPHSPMDVWAQMNFINDSVFGNRKERFKSDHCRTGGFTHTQVVGFRNEDLLREKINSVSFRANKAQLVDLPSLTEQTIYCELTGEARKVHNNIRSHGRTGLADVDGDTYGLTAKKALVRMLRAQQATSGFVGGISEDGKSIEKTIKRIPGSEKMEALEELILDAQGKPVVVFCRFKEELKMFYELSQKLDLRYGEISGSNKNGLQDSSPKMREDIDLLGVQIDSGGTGIDLTRSPIGIYYSKVMSFGNYDQSRARQHRSGQNLPVTLYSLVCEDSIDENVEAALLQKQDVANWYKTQPDKIWG